MVPREPHVSVICDIMENIRGICLLMFFLSQASRSKLQFLTFKDHIWLLFCWRGQGDMNYLWMVQVLRALLLPSFIYVSQKPSELELLPCACPWRSHESLVLKNHNCPYIFIPQYYRRSGTLITEWETSHLIMCHILTLNLLLSNNAPVWVLNPLCCKLFSKYTVSNQVINALDFNSCSMSLFWHKSKQSFLFPFVHLSPLTSLVDHCCK